MKLSTEQLAIAVSELCAIPYFPSESGAQTAIMRRIGAFVAGPSELRWLVNTAVSVMREWKGIPELRGLYCTRFPPVDGLPEDHCSIAGFTPGDSETAYLSGVPSQQSIAAADKKAVRLLKGRS